MDSQLDAAYWKALVLGLLRTLLASVGGVLMAQGYVTGDQWALLLSGVAAFLVALVTSALHKAKVRKILQTALELPAGASYKAVQAVQAEKDSGA